MRFASLRRVLGAQFFFLVAAGKDEYYGKKLGAADSLCKRHGEKSYIPYIAFPPDACGYAGACKMLEEIGPNDTIQPVGADLDGVSDDTLAVGVAKRVTFPTHVSRKKKFLRKATYRDVTSEAVFHLEWHMEAPYRDVVDGCPTSLGILEVQIIRNRNTSLLPKPKNLSFALHVPQSLRPPGCVGPLLLNKEIDHKVPRVIIGTTIDLMGALSDLDLPGRLDNIEVVLLYAEAQAPLNFTKTNVNPPSVTGYSIVGLFRCFKSTPKPVPQKVDYPDVVVRDRGGRRLASLSEFLANFGRLAPARVPRGQEAASSWLDPIPSVAHARGQSRSQSERQSAVQPVDIDRLFGSVA
eukprot:Polyplicarium_translucidae@DN2576_c0_g1_i3.p1